MCLGGGGGYTPPPKVMAPAPQPGPASPPDMVNNQQIQNANDRSEMEGNQNEYDPKPKAGQKLPSLQKKSELKVAQPNIGINL